VVGERFDPVQSSLPKYFEKKGGETVAVNPYRSTPHCRGRGRIVLFTVATLARESRAPACALA
jgi:hypothetical protein